MIKVYTIYDRDLAWLVEEGNLDEFRNYLRIESGCHIEVNQFCDALTALNFAKRLRAKYDDISILMTNNIEDAEWIKVIDEIIPTD